LLCFPHASAARVLVLKREFAKATSVLSAGRGDGKSRLNSSGLLSGSWMRVAKRREIFRRSFR
ncbi:MAG: hypothetical protein WCI46_15355, partial [Verrucomicrobiota bacterium]